MLLTDELLSKLRAACQRRCFGTFEPEDLYSMTLLRVTRSFDTFKGGEFQAWVMSVMSSTWKNELKRRAAGPDAHPLPDSILEGWDPACDSGYVLEEEVVTGFSSEMQDALGTLLPVQREALLLRSHGFTHGEITKILGLGSVGTACSTVHRARTKMQRALRENLNRGVGGALALG